MSDDFETAIRFGATSVRVGSAVFGIVNHKQIRSRCCGRSASVSLDIDNTTPVATNREPMLAEGSATK